MCAEFRVCLSLHVCAGEARYNECGYVFLRSMCVNVCEHVCVREKALFMYKKKSFLTKVSKISLGN